ncbi:hypothetical protein ACWYXN_06055 [Janthinobacterium aestuarii]
MHTELMVGEEVMTAITLGIGQGGRAVTQTALSAKEAGALSEGLQANLLPKVKEVERRPVNPQFQEYLNAWGVKVIKPTK